VGVAFMVYAQGFLSFLPLSVLLFEPDFKSRRRMLPFLMLGEPLPTFSSMSFCKQHAIDPLFVSLQSPSVRLLPST
jgi:hypothetical protein